MTTIKDGAGTGNVAKVNSKNRLFTNAITLDDDTSKAQDGDAYIMNSTDTTLTSANESAILYLKNNESRDLIVTSLAVLIGFTTGGSATELVTADVIRNPTAGTIIDDASPTSLGNRNFGSNNTLVVDSFKGAEGKTLTGGDVLIANRGISPSLGILTTALVLPRGSSIGVTITPSTGNTSMVVAIAVNAHLDGFNE